jgi:hypothetical protein
MSQQRIGAGSGFGYSSPLLLTILPPSFEQKSLIERRCSITFSEFRPFDTLIADRVSAHRQRQMVEC